MKKQVEGKDQNEQPATAGALEAALHAEAFHAAEEVEAVSTGNPENPAALRHARKMEAKKHATIRAALWAAVDTINDLLLSRPTVQEWVAAHAGHPMLATLTFAVETADRAHKYDVELSALFMSQPGSPTGQEWTARPPETGFATRFPGQSGGGAAADVPAAPATNEKVLNQ